MTFLQLILTVLFLGVLAGLVQKAPIIAAEYKSLALWILLVVAVLVVAYALLGGAALEPLNRPIR